MSPAMLATKDEMKSFYQQVSADKDWVDQELIPILDIAWGKRKLGFWTEIVRRITLQLYILEVWEDFPSTIERFRLLLVNKNILTRAELKDFGHFRDDSRICFRVCIGVFVRHYIHHGWYKLHSLGKGPDPDHPRLKDTRNVQDTYIFGGKLQFKRPDPSKQGKPPYEVQNRDSTRQAAPETSTSSEEEAAEGKPSHRPSNLHNETIDPEDPQETVARVGKWLHVLPRRPDHPPSEEVVRNAMKRITLHTKPNPRPGPVNASKGPVNHANGPPHFHAGRRRRHPQGEMAQGQGYAPRNGYGGPAPDTYQSWGIAPLAMPHTMPPAMPPQGSLGYMSDPYNNQALPQHSGGYPVSYPPYGSFAPPFSQENGGYPMPYSPQGYHAPTPQVQGGYHMAYAGLGNFATAPQVEGRYEMPNASSSNLSPVVSGNDSHHSPPADTTANESSFAHHQMTAPVFQPGAGAHHCDDANEFDQGTNGHSA